jgi:hypothetical protein
MQFHHAAFIRAPEILSVRYYKILKKKFMSLEISTNKMCVCVRLELCFYQTQRFLSSPLRPDV